MITPIHRNMRRCLLTDAGVRTRYLDPEDSLLYEGTTYKDSQACAAGTEGLTIEGTFSNAQVGQYVVNTTKDFEALILSKQGGTLTVHPPMQTLGTNWGTADGTTASKLVDSTATFTVSVNIGMIVALRDLTDYAIVTAVDSDTQLSLSKDIFASGDKYSIMPGFEVGDGIKVGTAVLDGTEGQVMVEIPKFYYLHEYNAGASSWSISPTLQSGYSLFPAFNPGGVEKDYIYISAFEGSIPTARNFDSPVLTGFNLGSDKLCSLPGLTPVTNGQRSEFRQVASNRGTGWHQWDHAANFAVQLLFMTEHETLNSQSVYEGITDWDLNTEVELLADNASDNRAIQQTGYTLRNGNSSVMSGNAPDASQMFSYRGIENFYGHLWKFVDGFKINDNKPYLCFNPSDYADDTVTGYMDLGVSMPASNGYQDAIHNTPYGLIPSSSGGGSSTYLCDYYYQNPSWRVARSGGHSDVGGQAGFAALLASYSSSTRYSSLGSRACFK